MTLSFQSIVLNRLAAQSAGAKPAEASRIGVISSLVPNPLLGLFIARSMARPRGGKDLVVPASARAQSGQRAQPAGQATAEAEPPVQQSARPAEPAKKS